MKRISSFVSRSDSHILASPHLLIVLPTAPSLLHRVVWLSQVLPAKSAIFTTRAWYGFLRYFLSTAPSLLHRVVCLSQVHPANSAIFATPHGMAFSGTSCLQRHLYYSMWYGFLRYFLPTAPSLLHSVVRLSQVLPAKSAIFTTRAWYGFLRYFLPKAPSLLQRVVMVFQVLPANSTIFTTPHLPTNSAIFTIACGMAFSGTSCQQHHLYYTIGTAFVVTALAAIQTAPSLLHHRYSFHSYCTSSYPDSTIFTTP